MLNTLMHQSEVWAWRQTHYRLPRRVWPPCPARHGNRPGIGRKSSGPWRRLRQLGMVPPLTPQPPPASWSSAFSRHWPNSSADWSPSARLPAWPRRARPERRPTVQDGRRQVAPGGGRHGAAGDQGWRSVRRTRRHAPNPVPAHFTQGGLAPIVIPAHYEGPEHIRLMHLLRRPVIRITFGTPISIPLDASADKKAALILWGQIENAMNALGKR